MNTSIAHDLHEAARSYASRGLRVLPLFAPNLFGRCVCLTPTCPGPGRHPRVAPPDATTDAGQTNSWWDQWDGANVGIATGGESGIVVLEVTGPEGQKALQDLGPLPRTWKAIAGGTEYIYFRHCGGTVTGFRPSIPSLLVRGDGDFVVAPPSLPRPEVACTWLVGPGEAELAEIPSKLRRLLGLEVSPAEAKMPAPEVAGPCDSDPNVEVDAGSDPHPRVGTAGPSTERVLTLAATTSARDQALPLNRTALYGLPGRIVESIAPHTEADPVAILANLLVGIGNLLGPGPHARVQYDRHPLRLYVVLVGPTSKARKGLSWSVPREMLSRLDPAWVKARVKTGLSSGEGLIENVRDRHDAGGQGDVGVADKRLLIIEPEFAVVLKIMGREGNSLSGVIRAAWDSGTWRL